MGVQPFILKRLTQFVRVPSDFAMAKKAQKTGNPRRAFPGPKRGRARMILKRPAAKCKLDQHVKYVRHGTPSSKSRIDRAKWCMNLKTIFTMDDKQLLDHMTDIGILKDWSQKSCPLCNDGLLSNMQYIGPRGGWLYRCRAVKCRGTITPHRGHPVFTTPKGQDFVPLRDQVAVLFCAVSGLTRSACHLLTGRNHKMVEGIYSRLDSARAAFVEKRQASMVFGQNGKWHDVEADEVDLRKTTLFTDVLDPESKNTSWEQWGAIVERGAPGTLVLERLRPNITKARAPGPGAMRKRDWQPIALKYIKGRSVVLHTDGAKAYRMKVPAVIHDNVVHAKKRCLVGGKVVWIKPCFTKVVTHTLPDGKTLRVKAGTQIVDRFWRHLRSFLEGNSLKVNSAVIRARVRSAQWVYWYRNEDLWAHTGKLLKGLHS